MHCSIQEAARFLGFKSRSSLYRLLNEGRLDDYKEIVEGRVYLNMRAKGKRPTLARYIASITEWRPDFELIDFDREQWLQEQAEQTLSQR